MTLRGVGEFMAVCFIMYVFLIVFSIMMMVQNGKSHFMEKELPRFEQMKENVSEFFKLLSTENLYEPLSLLRCLPSIFTVFFVVMFNVLVMEPTMFTAKMIFFIFQR